MKYTPSARINLSGLSIKCLQWLRLSGVKNLQELRLSGVWSFWSIIYFLANTSISDGVWAPVMVLSLSSNVYCCVARIQTVVMAVRVVGTLELELVTVQRVRWRIRGIVWLYPDYYRIKDVWPESLQASPLGPWVSPWLKKLKHECSGSVGEARGTV